MSGNLCTFRDAHSTLRFDISLKCFKLAMLYFLSFLQLVNENKNENENLFIPAVQHDIYRRINKTLD